MRQLFKLNDKDALCINGVYYCMTPAGLRHVLFQLRALGYLVEHHRYGKGRGDRSVTEFEALDTPMWTCRQPSMDAAVCCKCDGLIDLVGVEGPHAKGRPCEFCGTMTMLDLEGQGHSRNYEQVRFWRGIVYDNYGGVNQPPVSQVVYVYEAWRWSPLPLSDTLAQRVRTVGGLNSRRDWYNARECIGGRGLFGDMTVFVTRLTQLDPDLWRQRMRELPHRVTFHEVWDLVEELCQP